jgi:RNA polymerase sigma factor (sigma-70 family)
MVGNVDGDDRQLEGLRRREPDALAQLALRYERDILVAAQTILGNRADAEDVLMETLTVAWGRAGTVRNQAALRQWLLAVAANRSLTMRRRVSQRLRVATPTVESLVPDPGVAVPDRVDLLSALSELSPPVRSALVLRYFGDLSVAETAEALGKSPNTVKSQLSEGLARLRAAMRGRRDA